MSSRGFPFRNKATPRTRALKDAIVACFKRAGGDAAQQLSSYSQADWESALWWLDISGMALYFLDRAQQLCLQDVIPPSVHDALMRRLQRNQIRMRALHQESAVLSGWFREGRVAFAMLKGETLTPDSVPDSTLRCQTDIDVLIARQDLTLCIHYLHRLGYKLYAKSGNTLEFRAGAPSLPDLNNIYSVHTQRALEVHLLADDGHQSNLLTRRVCRSFGGDEFDTLSSPDIFVQQAQHLLKHLCGEHTRLSWVLEFWRHAQARRNDVHFWQQVKSIADHESNGNLAISIAFWIASRMFGLFDLAEFPQWREDSLPPRVRLWLERYVLDLLISDSTGSKLYALLRVEIPCERGERRSTKKILFPHYLPARLTTPDPNETAHEQWDRLTVEGDFFLRRLHFHLTEGIRFGIEVTRWKRALIRCGQ
jgi:hypothetical protein